MILMRWLKIIHILWKSRLIVSPDIIRIIIPFPTPISTFDKNTADNCEKEYVKISKNSEHEKLITWYSWTIMSKGEMLMTSRNVS